MKLNPKLSLMVNDTTLSYKFFEALEIVYQTKSQREAARILGVSHAVLNRRIKDSENKSGLTLVTTTGAGSKLTYDGLKILKHYQYLMKRLEKNKIPVICGGYISAGLLENLAADYGLDCVIYQTDDESALDLYDKGMVDILVLDDPVKAFMRDLDFIPLARDHFVLVTSSDEEINDVNDLEGKEYVEVSGSVQRLAWNTLDNMGVDYKIVKVLKSPFEALKIVKRNENLYTFLNNSLFNDSSLVKGSDLLKEDTNHLLTMVLFNPDNRYLSGFIDFINGRGRKVIKNLGFRSI
ncbi:MAG: LysR family transcriptional regulator [Methanobacterium sp.]|nr:LysR family transcriptional regulator [Methanobacterium sp.]